MYNKPCGWYSIYPCRPNPGAGGTFWGTALLSFLWNSNGRFNNHFYNSQIRFPLVLDFRRITIVWTSSSSGIPSSLSTSASLPISEKSNARDICPDISDSFLSYVRSAAVSVRQCSPEGWISVLSVSRSVAA